MLADIARLYKETRKPAEHYWTKYVSRPFAAAFVHLIKGTGISPNQVTLLAFFTSLVGAAVMVGWQTWPGLLVAIGAYQLAYILDCADGMLARELKISSKLGHLLDFLLDEIKAVVFLAAVSVRLHLIHDDPMYSIVGVGGVALMAAGLSLTTFTRRVEYTGEAQAVTEGPSEAEMPQRKSPLRRALGLVEWCAKQLINYPTYVVYLALFDLIEVYFWAIIGIYLLYTARTFLQVAVKMGRFIPLEDKGS